MPAPVAFGFGTPFAEQLEFFRQKLNLPSERWDDITRSAHDRAFIVAGAMKADLITDLRAAMDRRIEDGKGLEAFRKEFRSIVQKHGWTGWTGEGSKRGEAWRTRVIYQTNMATSYAAGRWRQLNDPELLSVRPFWRYVHADGVMHPRPKHKQWGDAKLTLRHDHQFWKTHYPPNGWGCHCYVHPVRGPEPGDATEPPSDWQEIDPKTGAPVGIDKGFGYAPGANVRTPLATMIDAKLIRLDSEVGATMWQALAPALAAERRLSWYSTYDDWRASGPVGAPRTHVLGALGRDLLAWLKAERNIVPATAEIAVQDRLVLGPKERRHQKAGDGLTDAEWRRLPELLDVPEQVLYDERSGHLLFVLNLPGDAAQKIAVEFDFRVGKAAAARRLNMIVSAYRQARADIDGEIRGGLWTVVK